MKVRIVSPGFVGFTGVWGQGISFTDGVSDEDLNRVQVNRIGGIISVVDAETGEPQGPAAAIISANRQRMEVAEELTSATDEAAVAEAQAALEADRLAAEEAARAEEAAKEAAALEAARLKAEEAAAKHGPVIYSRQELEAIAANDGISGLRTVATPLGVRGRSISELVNEILVAQTKLAE